jgi:hypothetical protein
MTLRCADMSPATQHERSSKTEELLQEALKSAGTYGDTIPVSKKTESYAHELIRELCHNEGWSQITEVYTASDGEIVFLWRTPEKQLEAWQMPSGQVYVFFSGERHEKAVGRDSLAGYLGHFRAPA